MRRPARLGRGGITDGRRSIGPLLAGRAELLARGAAQVEVTVASLLNELEIARQLALKLGQASAAGQATMGKAKLLGLIIDRRQVGHPGEFDHLTDAELVEKAARDARELGLPVPATH